MPDWEALQRAIDGEVLLPGSPGYEAAYRPAVARFHDVRPAAVVRCRTPEDVAAALALGLPAVARSGGHSFAGRSTTTGVVIDVGPMDVVSAGDGVATVGAGARLGRVYDALDEHGVTIPAGCGPDVGIAGLTLGGGLGILGRLHGLTCDSLLAAQVVLPDGRIVDVEDGELFWALRGAGGGHFGIVTAFTFRTLVPPLATAFDLRWPLAAAPALLAAWQAAELPDAVAASVLVGEDAQAVRRGAPERGGHRRRPRAPSAIPSRPPSVTAPTATSSATWRAPAATTPGTRTASPSSSAASCPPTRSRRWSTSSSRAPSSTSRPGAAPTTACRPTPPHSRTARSGSCSSRRSRSRPASRSRRPRAGSSARTGSPTRTAPAARTSNFPDPELDDELRAYWGVNHDRLVALKRSPAA